MNSKKLGVYLLSYKRPEYIAQAIDSLLVQTYQDFDLIVSDNSGDDSVYSVIKDYENRDLRVRILRQPRILSAPNHFNLIIAEAKKSYPYFMLFHDDDALMPDALHRLLQTIEGSPDASAVSCNAFILEGKSKKLDGLPLFNAYLNNEVQIKSPVELIRRYITPRLGHTPFPSYIYRSSCVEVSQIDTREGGKHADVTWLIKLLKKGRFIWLSEPLMLYRQHGGNDSATMNLIDIQSLCLYFFKEAPTLAGRIVFFYLKSVLKKFLKSRAER